MRTKLASLLIALAACGGDSSSTVVPGADAPLGAVDAALGSADSPLGSADSPLASPDAHPASPDAAPPSPDAHPASPDAPPPDAHPATPDAFPLGTPITAADDTWTWVDFPDSACDDGSPTGIGVNKSAASANVLIYLEGGGACWDYLTCYVLNTAVHGPFGAAQFAGRAPQLVGILDRDDAMNPYKDWNLVYVPYCTGDIHGGDNVITYTAAGQPDKPTHHVGFANVVAYAHRLGATFPSPPKLVVSGASAGGFGTTVNYPTLRAALAPAESYLVDDSGPLLEGDGISAALRAAWYASWRLDLTIGPICGAACTSDFSADFTALATRYPSDRFALLSSLQDATIRTYFGLSPAQFETDLRATAADVLAKTANFRYFFVTGDSHTMVFAPANFTSQTVHLWTWLTEQVTDSASWTSTLPPPQ